MPACVDSQMVVLGFSLSDLVDVVEATAPADAAWEGSAGGPSTGAAADSVPVPLASEGQTPTKARQQQQKLRDNGESGGEGWGGGGQAQDGRGGAAGRGVVEHGVGMASGGAASASSGPDEVGPPAPSSADMDEIRKRDQIIAELRRKLDEVTARSRVADEQGEVREGGGEGVAWTAGFAYHAD